MSINDNMKKINVSKVPHKATLLSTNRIKIPKSDENYRDRMENSKEIQWRRWEWMNRNPETYVNLMREQGENDADIQQMLSRQKPLDFDNLVDFEAFKIDVKSLKLQLTEAYELAALRFIQQGSSITGFSTNPVKGDRDVPNYIYNKAEGLDLDFRVYSQNLQDLYDQSNNIELKSRPELSVRLVEPSSARDLMPELQSFIEIWKPRLNSEIQFTLVLDYHEDYEPKP
jgi:hypothetical protein